MIQVGNGVVDKRAFRPRKADEHRWPAVVRVGGKVLAGLARRLLERRLQHQILDWVAGEIKLGEGDEIGALGRGFGAGGTRLLQIAVDIAHDRVELRKRKLEAVCDRVRHDRNLVRNHPNWTRHARPCAGHPRFLSLVTKTWMAGTSPAMTVNPLNLTYSPAAIEISGSGRPSRSRLSLSETMKASSSDWSALSLGSQWVW